MGGGGGEGSENVGRVEGVGSCPTLFEELTIRVVGPEAGVVRQSEIAEDAAVDFVIVVVVAPFVIVLSSDPRRRSGEKSMSS